MATLCPDHNLLFIHGRRTGSTAIRAVLHDHLGGANLPQGEVRDERGSVVLARHSTLPELLRHGALSAEERAGLFVFTAVRNPFDDLVSLYHKNRQLYQRISSGEAPAESPARMRQLKLWGSSSFEEVIDHLYRAPGWHRFIGRHRERRYRHTEGVDHVMRFERLQLDFDAALRMAGVEASFPLPQVNQTPERSRDYRRYYTPRTRAIVERVARHDLEQYGYEF